MRADPPGFNRLVSPFLGVDVVARLTQASLVRLNRTSGELEPRLARRWDATPDGLTWTLELVDAVFSDGVPFTAADVLFTFEALYDPDVKSELGSSLRIAGQPLAVAAPDDRTIVITFPAPYGAGLQLLDALPILPKHRLEPALRAGTFRDAWGLSTPPDEIVGLGPFVFVEYAPGQHMRFRRNPRFFVTDGQGRALPYLDELEIQIVSDLNTEMLRLEAGTVDLTTDEIRAEDYPAMRRLEDLGRVQMVAAGVSISPHALWFNLGATPPAERPWLGEVAFRRAVSHAVDRQALVDSVYLGAAEPIFGPVTPGHGDWYVADLPVAGYDPAAARTLLSSVGLEDRDGNGTVEDASGRPGRFSILTARGNAIRDRSIAVLQEQLGRVGLTVDVVALDVGSMVERWKMRDYDTMYFYVTFDSLDPARSMDFWLSSGSFHFWNPFQQAPATPWEARIDDLMRRQSTTLDRDERHRLFAEAQQVLAAQAPILYFAAPQVTYVMSTNVRGAQPSVLQPAVLWNAERLSTAPSGASSPR